MIRCGSRLSKYFVAAAAVMASSLSAASDDGLLKVVSPDLVEVDSYVFREIAASNQSGERVIIDAAMVGDEANRYESMTSAPRFSFAVPEELRDQRLCVDLATKSTGYRRVALMRLVKPVGEVVAHMENPSQLASVRDATTLVAFPTRLASDKPLDACLSQDEWIYPVRHGTVGKGTHPLTLRLLVNTGGGDAKLVQLGETGAAVGLPQRCARDAQSNGTYDRVCSIKLFDSGRPFARIKLTIGRRNASSVVKNFKVATTVGSR